MRYYRDSILNVLKSYYLDRISVNCNMIFFCVNFIRISSIERKIAHIPHGDIGFSCWHCQFLELKSPQKRNHFSTNSRLMMF